MKIRVKNFGSIKDGAVDLSKRVTVFVGYNSSGKTYLTQLLWGLSAKDASVVTTKMLSINNRLIVNGRFEVTSDFIIRLVSVYKDYVEKSLLADLFNVDESYFQDFSLSIVDDLLAITKAQFFSCIVLPYAGNQNEKYEACDHIYKSVDSLIFKKENESFEQPLTVDEIKEKYSDSEIVSITSAKQVFDIELDTVLFKMLFSRLFSSGSFPFFLPAKRQFYPSYYKYIYSVSKAEKDEIHARLSRNNANLDSIKALSKRPYTDAENSLIERVYDLNSVQFEHSLYADLLAELSIVLGGDIVIKSTEGIAPLELYLKLENGKELDMYMSSSAANQLTTLYLYLKYWARERNNFLIIDEPEENLHPENQIKLVNLLMKFADRNNNKILITTHSSLITDHINNFANQSYLNGKGVDVKAALQKEDAAMPAIETIKHSDYGVYFFDGVSIKEYEVGDYGAYFKDFQQAEDKVKDISNILKEHIYNNLHLDAKE